MTANGIRKTLAAAVLLGAMTGAFPLWEAAAAPTPGKEMITVTRAGKVTNGGGWDVTIPASAAGRLFDQVWIVVDGKRKGFGGGYFPCWDKRRTARLYANISRDFDDQVKDVLKAQGVAVKSDVTVCELTYGVNQSPTDERCSEVLHFRHSAEAFVYNQVNLPETAQYKIGDRITLFDLIAYDTDIDAMKVFDPQDPQHRIKPGLPTDLVHEIEIQVQFVRTGSNHLPLETPSSAP